MIVVFVTFKQNYVVYFYMSGSKIIFQYFRSGANFDQSVAATVGGSFIFTDYCPVQFPFSFVSYLRHKVK